MKITTVSHSHIALRQQLFFREVARQGHEVLMIAPGEWRDLRDRDYNLGSDWPRGSFQFRTCRHIGGEDIYNYRLLGARDLVEDFQPDWVYVQAEPGSALVEEAISWKVDKRALFTWENIDIKGEGPLQLPKYDLVICGNPDAEDLVKPHNPHTALMLQVGVDTDHFQARPGIERDIVVAYVGRVTPEKGLPYLKEAWPGVRVMDWKDFLELPWSYSQIQVLVAYSQDMPWWREQAPNYVVLEALSCGGKAVVSDTPAMEYWLRDCPGVVIVKGHEQYDKGLHWERVTWLREGIKKALEVDLHSEGRQWVINNFSNVVMAKKLLGVLEDA